MKQVFFPIGNARLLFTVNVIGIRGVENLIPAGI